MTMQVTDYPLDYSDKVDPGHYAGPRTTADVAKEKRMSMVESGEQIVGEIEQAGAIDKSQLSTNPCVSSRC